MGTNCPKGTGIPIRRSPGRARVASARMHGVERERPDVAAARSGKHLRAQDVRREQARPPRTAPDRRSARRRVRRRPGGLRRAPALGRRAPRNSSAEWLTTTTPAVGARLGDDRADRAASPRVEPGGGLVEQEIARREGEHAGDRSATRLPTGERERRTPCVLGRRQTDAFERLVRRRGRLGVGGAHVARAERHVGGRPSRRRAEPRRPGTRVRPSREPTCCESGSPSMVAVPSGAVQKPGRDAKQRGLARSGRAQDQDQFAGRYRERHRLERALGVAGPGRVRVADVLQAQRHSASTKPSGSGSPGATCTPSSRRRAEKTANGGISRPHSPSNSVRSDQIIGGPAEDHRTVVEHDGPVRASGLGQVVRDEQDALA